MKKEVLLLTLITGLLILGGGLVSADSCTVKGYVKNETGAGLGGVDVQISVDDPSGNYNTNTDNETFIGLYQKSLTCYQGHSNFEVIAYNSTHYGEASVTAADQETTFLNDIIMNETFSTENNPPKYYNDKDNTKLTGGIRTIAAGENVETSVLWKDENNLGEISLYSNITGDPDELYAVCNIGTKNVSWCNRSIDTSGQTGKIICWKEHGEDMTGNLNDSMSNTEHCFRVVEPFTEDSIELISPEYGSSVEGDSAKLKVKVTNPSGENMDVGFYDFTRNKSITTKSGVTNGSTVSASMGSLKEKTTYRWYVMISDGMKQQYSGLFSFTTRDIEEEEDKDKGGRQYTTYRPKDEDLEKGYKKKFFKNWDMDFNVGDNPYNAKVRDITDEKVDFSFNNQVLSMGDDETKKFDLDEDGYYDLQIGSSNLRGENGISSVDLEFKSIHEEIPAEEEPGKDEEQVEEKPEEPTEEKSYWYLWVLGIILVGVVAWLVLRNTKNSSKKGKRKKK